MAGITWYFFLMVSNSLIPKLLTPMIWLHLMDSLCPTQALVQKEMASELNKGRYNPIPTSVNLRQKRFLSAKSR